MDLYAQYLRKSRADVEAEQHGEGETLARHKHMLDALAQKMGIEVTKVYREIVSGETIAARPVMQQLLQDVESGMYKGVLVVEVERLARGDTIDQGIVSQTFKYSDTQIITPTKIYNPNNEFDEEYFEFGLFMSRREYKTINRRIQAGRLESAKEGKFPSWNAPFGYKVVKLVNEKGYTLEPLESEADAVKKIFDMYVNEHAGTTTIAHTLTEMGYKPRKTDHFTTHTIISILDNPLYAGYMVWGRRKETTIMKNGIITKTRPRLRPCDEYEKYEGRHEGLVSKELWQKAHEMRIAKINTSPKRATQLTNPLCGLIYCSKCGQRMQRRPAGSRQPADVIMCQNTACDNRAAYMRLIEERIIDSLKTWLNEYDVSENEEQKITDNIAVMKKNINKYEQELTTVTKQLNNAYDLLEQGVYTTDIFFQRSATLKDRIESLNTQIESVKKEILEEEKRQTAKIQFVPKLKKIIECYWSLDTPKSKNDILKEVIEKVVYTKNVKGRGHEDEFSIIVYPVVPKHK